MGLTVAFDVLRFIHQLFIDVQAACGIEENQIIAVLAGKVDACFAISTGSPDLPSKRGC